MRAVLGSVLLLLTACDQGLKNAMEPPEQATQMRDKLAPLEARPDAARRALPRARFLMTQALRRALLAIERVAGGEERSAACRGVTGKG